MVDKQRHQVRSTRKRTAILLARFLISYLPISFPRSYIPPAGAGQRHAAHWRARAAGGCWCRGAVFFCNIQNYVSVFVLSAGTVNLALDRGHTLLVMIIGGHSSILC